MKGKFLLFYLILFTKVLQAQLNFSLESNNQYYVDDSKIKLTDIEAENRFRSNSYLNVTYKHNKFTFGAQLESYEPKALLNYSPEFKGVNLIEILNYTCQILSGDTSDQWNYQVHAQQNQNK